MSREVPLLFSGHLVRAILGLDGKLKTQTRRPKTGERPPCAPGDTLWVRETWAEISPRNITGGTLSSEAGDRNLGHTILTFRATTGVEFTGHKWKPSIHMPRRAARVFLEVTAVRAECIAAISDEDARAEGFKDSAEFTRAWAGIYGSCEGWCWVIEFKRKEVDHV